MYSVDILIQGRSTSLFCYHNLKHNVLPNIQYILAIYTSFIISYVIVYSMVWVQVKLDEIKVLK